MKYCQGCGTQLSDETKICHNCGYPVDSNIQVANNKSSSTTDWIVTGIISCLILCIPIIVLFVSYICHIGKYLYI